MLPSGRPYHRVLPAHNRATTGLAEAARMSTTTFTSRVLAKPTRRYALVAAAMAFAAVALALLVLTLANGGSKTASGAKLSAPHAQSQVIGNHGIARPIPDRGRPWTPPANDGSQHPGQRP